MTDKEIVEFRATLTDQALIDLCNRAIGAPVYEGQRWLGVPVVSQDVYKRCNESRRIIENVAAGKYQNPMSEIDAYAPDTLDDKVSQIALKTIRPVKMAGEGRLKHTVVEMTIDGKVDIVCGETHCKGDCGFPAGIAYVGTRTLKLHSSNVAVGHAMQPLRDDWKGTYIYIDEKYHERLVKLIWW